ncbi:hypothetical protein TWF730_008645 [Orbilia blumenaviensis]|uniref:Uncharacterized protein n=1 Tax=Orbilia blumenaviensis TaxID=1796055 RepID=A0AAV9V4K7_9PEZI
MSSPLASRVFVLCWLIALFFSVSIQAQLTAGTAVGTATWAAPTNGTPTATLTPPTPTNTESSSTHNQFSSSLALFGALIAAALFSL